MHAKATSSIFCALGTTLLCFLCFESCIISPEVSYRVKSRAFIVEDVIIPERDIIAIWEEAEKVLGIHTIMPEVFLVPHLNGDYNGLYFSRSKDREAYIEIYYWKLLEDFNSQPANFVKQLIYNTIAHEFVHHLYSIKYGPNKTKNDATNHHCIMRHHDHLFRLFEFIKTDILQDGSDDAIFLSLDSVKIACAEAR